MHVQMQIYNYLNSTQFFHCSCYMRQQKGLFRNWEQYCYDEFYWSCMLAVGYEFLEFLLQEFTKNVKDQYAAWFYGYFN